VNQLSHETKNGRGLELRDEVIDSDFAHVEFVELDHEAQLQISEGAVSSTARSSARAFESVLPPRGSVALLIEGTTPGSSASATGSAPESRPNFAAPVALASGIPLVEIGPGRSAHLLRYGTLLEFRIDS